MTDLNEERFARIERNLNLLVSIAIGQSVLLVLLAVGLVLSKLFGSTMYMVLFLLLVIGFIVIFRKQIPGWIGSLSRYAFGKMLSSQKSDSAKDIS